MNMLVEQLVDDFGKELCHLLQSAFQHLEVQYMNVFAESIADECAKILLYLLQYVLSKKGHEHASWKCELINVVKDCCIPLKPNLFR